MRTDGFTKTYLGIALVALLLFVISLIHPGPFYVSFRIPDPRTLLEIALGVIFIVAIILLAKSKFSKQIKIAFISALVSITLYFILRFIHIPGKILWGILVLSLMAIIWAAVTVFSKKGK